MGFLLAMSWVMEPTIRLTVAGQFTIETGNRLFHRKGRLACKERIQFPVFYHETGRFELGAEGRVQWKKEIGYHRRSLVETFMFRYKTIVGDRLSAKKWQTQVAEVKIKLVVINRMTELGMPESYKRII